MNELEVTQAIEYMQNHQTETDKLEAKTAEKSYPKKCYDTISAFANKNGGVIIFGINEHNSFIEQDVYDVNDLQKQITALCTTSMEPKIRPEFLPIIYKGKKLLAVKIDEISEDKKPCFYKLAGIQKDSYIRVGDSDEHMTEYEIYNLESYRNNIQEDLRPIPRARLEDFNQDKLDRYISKIKSQKVNFSKFSNEKILKLSGIIDDITGVPTLAGTLVFSEWPQAYLPQLFIACVVIPGTQLGDVGEFGQRFNDNVRVEGTIEEMLDGALKFISRNIGTMVIIDSNGKRKDVPHYPMKALREAIVNALVHRDYSVYREGAYVYVQIYDDRIEIISPGELYGKRKIENLGTNKMLEVRNKTIVKLLEETTDIVENRHTGIVTMREEMKNMKLPEPEIIVSNGDFKVIFRRKNTNTTQETTQEITQESLSDSQEKILNLIKANSYITQKEMANVLGLTRDGIKYNIKMLVDKNIIKREGATKNGRWKIIL